MLPVVIRLAVTLRWLAGASHDLIFGYNIREGSFHEVVSSAIEALDRVLPGIYFPFGDEAKLAELEHGFAALSGGIFRRTVSAADGVLFRMDKPAEEEVYGDVASYLTRKGYFTHAMIALL